MFNKVKLIFKAISKFAKYIAYGVISILVVLLIIIGSANTKHSKQVKQLKQSNKELQLTIDSLSTKYDQLASMDAIRVDVSMTVKSTNVLGVTNLKADQIAHTIAAYTRGELLDSLINNQ